VSEPRSTATRRGEITLVRRDDYPALAAFMASFPGTIARSEPAWRNRLSAWWDANPAFDESLTRGWMLRDEGRISGFFGSIPLKVQLGGAETRAFTGTSWRVLPEQRGGSLGLKLKQLQAHPEHAHFSTTPLEELLPLLQRLGYQRLERGPDTDQQSQFVHAGDRFLEPKIPAVPGRALLATIGAPALAVVQAFRMRPASRFAHDDVRELPRADAAFDVLWERTRTRYPNTNVRTAAVVNWYCFAIQPAEKKLLAYYDRDALAGYMVLWMKDRSGRRFMECVDVWIDPAADEARVLGALVAKAAACARREAFERVLFPYFHPHLAALYRRLGLFSGPAQPRREFIKVPAHLREAVTPDTSYFVRAQGDYGL
jgi:hypothetical protein